MVLGILLLAGLCMLVYKSYANRWRHAIREQSDDPPSKTHGPRLMALVAKNGKPVENQAQILAELNKGDPDWILQEDGDSLSA